MSIASRPWTRGSRHTASIWMAFAGVALLPGSARHAQADSTTASIQAAATPRAGAGTNAGQSAAVEESFRPLATEQLERRRRSLRSAAEALERFLARGPADNAAAWKRYLRWDTLQQQLAAEGPPDPQALAQVLTQFFSGAPGLELPPFVRVREGTLAWQRQALGVNSDDLERLSQEQLSAVERELAAATQPGGPLGSLAARLQWLEQLGQAPRRVAAIRRQFNHPNLLVSASADAVSRGFTEGVSEVTPVNEMILNTHVCGTAHLQGDLSANLVPSRDSAIIELTLTGVAHSQTIGRQSPVRIYSQGATQVLATKRLLIDPSGVRELPATACCVTDNHIHRIQSEKAFASHLIERVAWKRARQQEPLAERISAGRAERRIARRMDQQAIARVAASNTRLQQEVRSPLRARNVYPRWVHLWTTGDRLRLAAVQGQNSQLGAPSLPTQASGGHRVVAQVHESMLLNTAANGIGGLTVTDERAQQLVKELTGEVPAELELRQDEDPWAITFDLQTPVHVEFHNNQMLIAIRGRRFTRGDQEVRQTIQIAARYQLGIENGRARLTRVGDVEVTFPEREGERLSLTELRNKTFMTDKFKGLFKPEIGGEGLPLEGPWQRLNEMQLAHISSDNGWLTLGWN